jgi:hypothetical protein
MLAGALALVQVSRPREANGYERSEWIDMTIAVVFACATGFGIMLAAAGTWSLLPLLR